jgi:hypothetical protein
VNILVNVRINEKDNISYKINKTQKYLITLIKMSNLRSVIN